MVKLLMREGSFRKIITAILGFFGIMTFTSCYGMPANYTSLYGRVTGDDDRDDLTPAVPVQGIQVTVKDSANQTIGSMTTNADGYYDLEIDEPPKSLRGNLTFTFEDIDGEENGVWETKTETIAFTKSDGDSIKVYAELTTKTEN
ncbi:MAG: radical SAM-associated putative lipoprotein [Treponemataceae bacterium]|nr:radical SAM-associated putative lipoprotein [Treponemataceae bacterium]